MLVEIKEIICASIHDVKNRIWFLEQQIRQMQDKDSAFKPISEELSRLSTELSLILMAQRQTSKTFSPHYEEVWLDEWILELQASIPSTPISLAWDLRATCAFFDPNMVSIAVRELLFNAIKNAKSHVNVDIYTTDAGLHIAIHNDNPHMAQHEDADNLAQNSTGLGLTLARYLIQAHSHNQQQGKLTLFCHGKSGGTTSEITLP